MFLYVHSSSRRYGRCGIETSQIPFFGTTLVVCPYVCPYMRPYACRYMFPYMCMCSAPAIQPASSGSGEPGNDVWAERFAPSASADLAVHKDKVKELKEWIELNRSHLQRGSSAGQRLLLLCGPSGAGKTAMVKVAAAGLSSLCRWLNTCARASVRCVCACM